MVDFADFSMVAERPEASISVHPVRVSERNLATQIRPAFFQIFFRYSGGMSHLWKMQLLEKGLALLCVPTVVSFPGKRQNVL